MLGGDRPCRRPLDAACVRRAPASKSLPALLRRTPSGRRPAFGVAWRQGLDHIGISARPVSHPPPPTRPPSESPTVVGLSWIGGWVGVRAPVRQRRALWVSLGQRSPDSVVSLGQRARSTG